MHLGALLLAIAASVCWSGLDACRKSLAARLAPVPIVFSLTLGQVPLFGLWALGEAQWTILPGYTVPAALSILLNTVANLLFIRAVQLSPLSLTVPLLSLTPVFTTIMGSVLLHEAPTWRQWLGILLVVAGAFALHGKGKGTTSLSPLWQAYRIERGSVLMTGVALLWSMTAPLDKLAMAYASLPLHGFIQCAGMSAGLFGVLVVRRQLRALGLAQGQLLPLLGAVAFGAAAYGLQLLALQALFVAIVEVIKRVVGLVGALGIGSLVFAEPLTWQKFWAVGLMSTGTILVLLQQ